MDSDVILLSSGKGVPPSITRHGNDQGASGSNQLYAVKSNNPGEVARILRADEFTGINGETLYVVARPGTMSSHGGQIADILKNSGQPNVRIEPVTAYTFQAGSLVEQRRAQIASILHDRMTQVALWDEKLIQKLFDAQEAPSENYIDISQGSGVMQAYNEAHEIGLSESDISHLYQYFKRVRRNPTNVELMMFAQANSEHCRHKIFNAELTIDEVQQSDTLFAQIKKTHRANPNGVVNAYKDNTSVGAAKQIQVFQRGPDGKYGWYPCKSIHPTLKAETHNHPTGIAAFPGAATGAGGEIRDEAAPGQGGESRMGFTGFTVSRLDSIGSDRNASPTQIMIDGPLGGVAFNNEFGRPGLAGYFRTYRWKDASGKEWGYQKPIMLAGGTGEVNTEHTQKKTLPPGTLLIQIGGPGMSIGVGGGAASSMVGGQNSADADFKSVQRGSPEMQRRGQEVINATRAMGENTPVLSIHDVGAGGLSNAFPELAHQGLGGAIFDYSRIPVAENMDPATTWSNESQERYVLAIPPERIDEFRSLCERERCPMAIVGSITEERQLILEKDGIRLIDMEMDALLEVPADTAMTDNHIFVDGGSLEMTLASTMSSILPQVLANDTVGDKKFLITIGDRSVQGRTVRDQMVGPYQVPVADMSIIADGFTDYTGTAVALGERSPLAIVNPSAASRMALGEALTNLLSARVNMSQVVASANWMAAAKVAGQLAALNDGVTSLSELARKLKINIPTGKDSLSMRVKWSDADGEHDVISPVSLNLSITAPMHDIRHHTTPELQRDPDTELLLIDLGKGRNRLGGSILAQIHDEFGNDVPDMDDPDMMLACISAINQLHDEGLILAYHDRSDGGLVATLSEMMFASHIGLDIDSSSLGDALSGIFNEELGIVIQIKKGSRNRVREIFSEYAAHIHTLGTLNLSEQNLTIAHHGQEVFKSSRQSLQDKWGTTSNYIRNQRDNPDSIAMENEHDLGENPIIVKLPERPVSQHPAWEIIREQAEKGGEKPRIAIIREQGTNGHIEMAAMFAIAGFEPVDVHMSDIIEGRVTLTDFNMFAACGGFSYSDALGAGTGWATNIIENTKARQEFSNFFQREDTLALGVCNGCQMMSQIAELIPGTQNWPELTYNDSWRFEARTPVVKINAGNAKLFEGMDGAILPISSAHGEGKMIGGSGTGNMQFVDSLGNPTEHYPANPNGSAAGNTALTSENGRFTAMMPHPERSIRTINHSYIPLEARTEEFSPWMNIALNARQWVHNGNRAQ